MSRYYESDYWYEVHPLQDYVNADIRLDPEGEDVPQLRLVEIRRAVTRAMAREGRLQNREEDRDREAQRLSRAEEPDSGIQVLADIEQEGPELRPLVEQDASIVEAIRSGYKDDAFWKKVVANITHFKRFSLDEGLIFGSNHRGTPVLGIPRGKLNGKSLTGLLIQVAHEALGHMGDARTEEYIRRFYWWPAMRGEIEAFCRSCGACQTSKVPRMKPAGLLKSLPTPSRPWGSIAMDFAGPLPKVDGKDYLWIVIDRLTSLVHLVPTRTTVTAPDLAILFLKEIVRLHGLPDSIVSDRDSKFTSHFWQETHRVLGIKLKMSTAFHPQTDGKSERLIQIVNQVLRAQIQPDQKDWLSKLPMVEFAINSSTNAATGFAPFELTYGYMPVIHRPIPATPFAGVRDFVQQAHRNLTEAQDALIESRVAQTHYANAKRREEPQYEVGDRVYLSTQNLALPKGRVRKLLPRFIGPFEILKANLRGATYTLKLTDEMVRRKIHPTFHISLLKPYIPNDESQFPGREATKFYDVGIPEDQEWVVDSILDHRWVKKKLELKVRWALGDVTWEPRENCEALQALDDYLTLIGVNEPEDLPRPGPSKTTGDKKGKDRRGP